MKRHLVPVLFGAATALADTPQWQVQVVQSPVVTERTFSAGDELSGIASLNGKDCVVVSNETRCAQMAVLERDPWRLRAGEIIPLSAASGDEMDLEAVAANTKAHCYYVLGSHAVSKQKGKRRPDQEVLARIPADPKTGKPTADRPEDIETTTLMEILRGVPELNGTLGRPLQQNGLNLEGMTCQDGKLFIGCRGPSLEGAVPVLEMEAEALFKSPPPKPTVSQVQFGKGLGIRDMASLRDGNLLILTGSSGSPSSEKFPSTQHYDGDKSFSLWLWKPGGGAAPTHIAPLPAAPGSAEGLLVVEESPEGILVLVLFDGAYNGAPKLLKLVPPGKAEAAPR